MRSGGLLMSCDNVNSGYHSNPVYVALVELI
jgi:hypothetical protein